MYFTEYEGEDRHILLMNSFKHPIDDIDRAEGNELWTGDRENADYTILDEVINTPRSCYLIHESVSAEQMEMLKSTFEVVEVCYEKKNRFGIACGYYQQPTGDVPFQVIEKWSVQKNGKRK